MAIKEVVMVRYSVATTKNNLSSLIDKALAGEEVVITRHGKPTVAMRPVSGALWKFEIRAFREQIATGRRDEI
jgi:prevent-host-death family protein